MRIGIDARLLNEAGIGRYLRNLIKNLQTLDQENDYFLFLLAKDMPSLKVNANFCKVEANFHWYSFAEQTKFPGLLHKFNLDLMHFPHFNVPIFYRGKFVVTIHDLIHQHFQMRRATTRHPLFYQLKKLGYQSVFSHAVKKSTAIIAPSNFVKDQLVAEWRVNKDKITVTYEGVDDEILALAHNYKPADYQQVAQKFSLQKPFLFYIGNAHPHKNLEMLTFSFVQLAQTHPEYQLVLSGAQNYFWQELKNQIKDLKNVTVTGFVSDQELVALYKNAECFVMPSLEEGFGIPILEAFACNCPVITSSFGSLSEIGKKAALYFNPLNKKELVNQILQLRDDSNLRTKLIENGKQRVRDFSWHKMAEQTLQIYHL